MSLVQMLFVVGIILFFNGWILRKLSKIERDVRIIRADQFTDTGRIIAIKGLVHKIFTKDLKQMLDDKI